MAARSDQEPRKYCSNEAGPGSGWEVNPHASAKIRCCDCWQGCDDRDVTWACGELETNSATASLMQGLTWSPGLRAGWGSPGARQDSSEGGPSNAETV